MAAGLGCGKKGPPLAPFVRVPAAVTAVTPLRIGDDVYLSFAVPSTNADGQKPATISALEIYAVTSELAPKTEKQRDVATLIATVPVRSAQPPPPVSDNGSPEPAVPLPPGVDQGATMAVRETITADARVPVELPVDRLIVKPVEPVETEERIGTLVAPPPTQLPRRHYFVVGVSPRGRKGEPSTPVSIPLEAGSSAPGPPTVTNTATSMTITWTPPPDARSATFLLPPKPSVNATPPVPAADAAPSTVPPPLPPRPLLTARSLGFNSTATTYHVYDVTPRNASPAGPSTAAPPAPDATKNIDPEAGNPFALKTPAPITPAPVADTEYVLLKGFTFDTEICFVVRPVDQVFGATVIGPASPTVCVTPKDTFPPVAPKSLQAIAGSGVISLIWDPNTESDLAGYIVLRGEAPGDTLQAVTTEPVIGTSYRDETVKPGTRYVYAVVAVDRAKPQNVSPRSNRAEETARQ
jgi:hypothetical protein